MGKHSKDQTSGKPNQTTQEARNTRTSRGAAAPSSSANEQVHQPEIVEQPETTPLSREQYDTEARGIHAWLIMVGGESIEVDNESTVAQWGSESGNPRVETQEQLFHGRFWHPLSTNNLINPATFNHMGAHVPLSSYPDTEITKYTEPLFSGQTPMATSQTVAYCTLLSHNSSSAATPYQTAYDSPLATTYCQPVFTSENVPDMTQLQLAEVVYYDYNGEIVVVDSMEQDNYDG